MTDKKGVKDAEIPFGEYETMEESNTMQVIQAKITKQGQDELSYFIFRYETNKIETENELIIDRDSGTFLHRFGFGDGYYDKILRRRVVFVMDKSGSMWPIWDQAQAAITGAIQDLRKDFDRFGVVLFDSYVEQWNILIANDKNVDLGVKRIMDQRPGSTTNLYGGIEAALLMIEQNLNQDEGNIVNQIIFVTDGRANQGIVDSNDLQTGIEEINNRIAITSNRVSIFGIGISADHGNDWVSFLNYPLIRQISIQNDGFDKRIKKSETKQDLQRYYKILQSAQLSNIEVKYESGTYEFNKLTQHTFSALYAGTDIVISGKLKHDKNTIKSASQSRMVPDMINTIINADNDTEIRKEFMVSEMDGNINIDIDRIWAYLSLKYYEKLLLQNADKVGDTMRRLINENALNIALTFNLVTPWTSMIVVADTEYQALDESALELLTKLKGFAIEELNYNYYESDSTSAMLLLDVTPLSFGIEDYDGNMITIIERNSIIPTRKQRIFKGNELAQFENGTIIRIFQGERKNVTHNILLYEYKLFGSYNDSNIEIEVIFEIDANGNLQISSRDDINDLKQVIISAEQAIQSQETIDEMLNEAEFYHEQDALAIMATKMVKACNSGDTLDNAAKRQFMDDFENIMNWMEQNENKKINITEKQKYLQFLKTNVVKHQEL